MATSTVRAILRAEGLGPAPRRAGPALTEMTTFQDGYGLGLYETDPYGTPVVGHAGEHVGYAARAMCFVEDGSVVVVLTNRENLGTGVAEALAVAARSD